MAYVLWTRFLKHNPRHPDWFDRDRFVLSAGHGSMLLYGLLHLTGYDLSLDDIKQFRQWGSKTPGHPERGHTPGVEDHDRTARTGICQCGGNGHRRSAAGGTLQPTRVQIVDRSRDVRDRQRRRLDGGCCRRSRFTSGAPAARQTHLPVRRQQSHSRRRHRHHLLGGSRPPLRSLWLAHRIGRRRQRPRVNRQRLAGRERGKSPRPR